MEIALNASLTILASAYNELISSSLLGQGASLPSTFGLRFAALKSTWNQPAKKFYSTITVIESILKIIPNLDSFRTRKVAVCRISHITSEASNG